MAHTIPLGEEGLGNNRGQSSSTLDHISSGQEAQQTKESLLAVLP
jgi:hypothetical protein